MKRATLRKAFFIFAFFGGGLALFWFVLFQWRFLPYPLDSRYGPKTCYSPNHEYYVKRYQTPFEYFIAFDPLYAKGIAILYDKTGKEIYRGYAPISAMFGPDWFSIVGPDWSHNSVGYYDTNSWYTKLPSFPGEHPDRSSLGCFDEISHYVSPPIKYHQDYRKSVIKAVEPLEKTKAPYQLQFLVEDQHGVPRTPFYYMIIRTDGSRQRGETDENGRTFVIESAHEESVSFYHSPLRDEEGFMMPEFLEQWCAESPNNCISPSSQTVAANTIKIDSVKNNKSKEPVDPVNTVINNKGVL